MNALKLCTLLSLLPPIAISRAVDPLDTWTWRNPLPAGESLNSIAYGGGQFLGVSNPGTIVTSPDVMNWGARQSGTQRALNGIAFGNGQFVAVGAQTILASSDAVTWVQRTSETKSNDWLNAVTFANGQFVAVGSGYNTVK